MKTHTLTGIVLIVIGIVAFAYQGITYTIREKVVSDEKGEKSWEPY
jgi:hypothetical protein